MAYLGNNGSGPGFQSLFSWNLLLMYKSWWQKPRLLGVSILVFVELALDVCRPPSGSLPQFVSILVFVELALDGQFSLQAGLDIGVSILVFVELALDDPVEEPWELVVPFQSLFSWNLLLMMIMGFTPYRLPLAFQSLFSWNLLLMRSAPCTSGHIPIQFQSLFSWNLLLMGDIAKGILLIVMFQSLFSWNLLLMFCSRLHQGPDFSGLFQSLFSWNLLLMLMVWMSPQRRHWVSILVFVELALDAWACK